MIRRRNPAPATSKTTGRTGTCQVRMASRTDAAAHSSRVSLITSAGMPARRRRAGSSVQRFDRNSRQLTGTLSSSDANHTPWAYCPATGPAAAPPVGDSTPTDRSPSLGMARGWTTQARGAAVRCR
ncbi:hypothetical protein ADL29_32175 [Streptomyces chattanoogensis]|uniref:Uncharacterized protein n=1 Tax=Streptomyces chattanoogensis TaxID=66876 RepID=A0A0N1JVX7_9ACTN|nr:hypothetical protein ADL29_32175 [Streptomyces chattanoogensis]